MRHHRWLISLVFPLLLSGCLGKNVPTITQPSHSTSPTVSPTQTAANLLSSDATAVTADLTHEFGTVTGLAQAWHKDAVLYAMTSSFPADLQIGHAKRVYIFGSAVDPTNWWTVAINEESGERIRSIIPKEDYLGSLLPPMPTQYWKLNVVQALQAAESAGGTVFRQGHPGSQITAALAQQGPNNWLWWTLNYRGDNNETLTIRVHPGTGQIYDDQGKPVTPATAAPQPTTSATH